MTCFQIESAAAWSSFIAVANDGVVMLKLETLAVLRFSPSSDPPNEACSCVGESNVGEKRLLLSEDATVCRGSLMKKEEMKVYSAVALSMKTRSSERKRASKGST